jgi:hypothetical protein
VCQSISFLSIQSNRLFQSSNWFFIAFFSRSRYLILFPSLCFMPQIISTKAYFVYNNVLMPLLTTCYNSFFPSSISEKLLWKNEISLIFSVEFHCLLNASFQSFNFSFSPFLVSLLHFTHSETLINMKF